MLFLLLLLEELELEELELEELAIEELEELELEELELELEMSTTAVVEVATTAIDSNNRQQQSTS